jgi:hypothetical protein
LLLVVVGWLLVGCCWLVVGWLLLVGCWLLLGRDSLVIRLKPALTNNKQLTTNNK